MSAVWRLIVEDSPADGAWNMALDRAIQLSREAGLVPATLRLYRWVRPTVTLGHFQDADTIDLEFCDRNGVDVVRRFTGGRGVLHDDELTYSIVAGLEDGIPRGVAASYRMLCTGLAETYRLLGVDAALTALPRGDRASAACYLHSTAADLSVGARKLSGSAQVWHGSTVLQHGSFTVSRDAAREATIFKLAERTGSSLTEHAATLDELLDSSPTTQGLIDAAVQGIGSALGISLVAGTPLDSEVQLAQELLPRVARDNAQRGRRG